MNYGQRFVTLYRNRDQDHPHGKEMQNSKMAVWGSLTNSSEKKRSESKGERERYSHLFKNFPQFKTLTVVQWEWQIDSKD